MSEHTAQTFLSAHTVHGLSSNLTEQNVHTAHCTPQLHTAHCILHKYYTIQTCSASLPWLSPLLPDGGENCKVWLELFATTCGGFATHSTLCTTLFCRGLQCAVCSRAKMAKYDLSSLLQFVEVLQPTLHSAPLCFVQDCSVHCQVSSVQCAAEQKWQSVTWALCDNMRWFCDALWRLCCTMLLCTGLQFVLIRVQCEVCSALKCAANNRNTLLCSMQCLLGTGQCEENARCAVFSIYCAACNVYCGVCRKELVVKCSVSSVQ